MTQGELSKVLGVPRSTLALWETGAKKVPPHLVPLVSKWVTTGEAPVNDGVLRDRRLTWAKALTDRSEGLGVVQGEAIEPEEADPEPSVRYINGKRVEFRFNAEGDEGTYR